MLVLTTLVTFLSVAVHAQNQTFSNPQCSLHFNGTVGNGTAGSEQQLESTTLRFINATDANQGVAVDREHIYTIDNYSITKRHKGNGSAVLQWYGGPSGAVIHLDGGVVVDGTLYAPHSNYPGVPISSSVETWDVATMRHTGSHPFGLYRGSLTWVDQDPSTGTWYGVFANYDKVQPGQTQPYGLTMDTQLVQFDGAWAVARSWVFPRELYGAFSPMSNSGGSFGPDGWLYITGHDAGAVYVVRLPAAGSVLVWVATIAAPDIAGQGIAWDRDAAGAGYGGGGGNGSATGTLYGISRESRQVVVMSAPLQQCGWSGHIDVGAVLGPGHFVDTSQD